MRLKIENWMRYRYERPVSFSRHIIRLYPRADQKIVTRFLRTEINLPNDVQYRRDLFDNLVASCFLPEAGEALEIKVQLEVELWPTNPFHFLLAPHAAKLPFEYEPEEQPVLAPYRAVSPQEQADTETLWRLDGSRDTVSALVDLARTLHAEIGYEVREEGAARLPAETLALRSGACRDIALLCATILRKIGLAVRVVSGFLCEFQVDVETRRAERGLHAWIELFLPGAGWIGIDPTNGTFCDHHFIPTAVGINMADIASVHGAYFGKERGEFESRLDMGLITEKDPSVAAESVEKTLAGESVRLTMGAEPTFVPINPEAPEWNYVALGASKLEFAYKFANQIIEKTWPEAIVLYTPGKLYPGETNPRWAVQLLQSPGSLVGIQSKKKPLHKPDRKLLNRLKQDLLREFHLENGWLSASDPGKTQKQVLILPLDHREGRWISEKWDLRRIELVQAEGPAGLRLPLGRLGDGFTKRALVLEVLANSIDVFLPPLLTEPWIQLIRAVHSASGQSCRIRWQGYVPVDLPTTWKRLGFTADPGVLEVNLPPCETWKEFQEWLVHLDTLSQVIGLRTCKTRRFEVGTGGGCHLLFGGVSLEENPFFTRPGWLASILRYWQHHPSLSYLFTGCYVGVASQAPRPDESGNSLLDLELTYQQLERLPPGDSRQEIHALIRHLHTDLGGNTHRSEISFDKFWNAPAGMLGLIEFRAVESLPNAEWAGAAALLWRALLAYLLKEPFRSPLEQIQLHDRYFLPSFLWQDLTNVLSDLAEFGFGFDPTVFRQIWEWRFPMLLDFEGVTIRLALEGWPLLAEEPIAGGSTSRFVDSSMERLEVTLKGEALEKRAIFFNGRELPLRSLSRSESIAGLRYRRSALYPSLHMRIGVQLPLIASILDRSTSQIIKQFRLEADSPKFIEHEGCFVRGSCCEPVVPGDYTYDLRIGAESDELALESKAPAALGP